MPQLDTAVCLQHLLSTSKTTAGMPCPGLSSPVQEHGHTELVKGCKDL